MKRVLDLSPERLSEIIRVDPSIFDDLKRESSDYSVLFNEVFQFWESCSNVAPKITEALSIATECEDLPQDSHYNYRMVDYYERSLNDPSPRCGEHRDFGSYSIIFADRNGLEVFIDNKWQKVITDSSPTKAIMLFGWCTQIRSNGRISAVLHRVVDSEVTHSELAAAVPRRISAVLFVAPKEVSTALEPVVLEGEKQRYVSGIKVGQLRGSMARKWGKREGKDILLHGATQDEFVKKSLEIAM